jgi:hypothetical protein
MATPLTVVGWMTAICVGTGAALAALVPGWTPVDVAAGVFGPLVAAIATWILVERGARTNPAGLTAVMMTAFFVKLVFFGVYVVVMLKGLRVAPIPFVTTFTAYFVGLYVAEGVLMHRLFSRRETAAS